MDEKQVRFRAMKEGDVVAVISYLSTFSDETGNPVLPACGDLGVVADVCDCVAVRVPMKPHRTWNFYACYDRDDLRPATQEELVAWELAFAKEQA